MRKKLLGLLLFATVFAGCDKDDAISLENGEVEFQGNSAIIRADDMSNIRFKNLQGNVLLDDRVPEGQIRVEASGNLSEWLSAKTEGGELRLEGKDGLPVALDLHFHLHPRDIARIVVEGDRRVFIASTPMLEHLELVTEGASELDVHGLRVRHLKSRREGKSRMYLSNGLLDFKRDSIYFPLKGVEVLDDSHLVYVEDGHSYLLYAPTVTVRNDSVFALTYDASKPLRSFFLTHTHELVNQGESYLDALELPTLAVTSKNEGESEAKVWAVHNLNVKGEGESVLRYFGNPQVRQDLKGSAQLTRWP